MSEPSEWAKNRLSRRQGPVAAAWDGSQVSQADRRRLAEVQEAKRKRRDGADDLSTSAGARGAVSPNVSGDASAASGQHVVAGSDDPRAVTPVPRTGAAGNDDRVHVDASLALPRDPARDAAPKNVAELSILVVCTGNVCRSPYFEHVLADALRDLPVAVSGAGTGALLIDRMASGSAALLTARGIDPAGFRPRQLEAAMVREADLVLTATREHRRVVVEEAPTADASVFALLDFAAACAAVDPAAHHGGGAEGFRAFVREAGARTIERRSGRSDEAAAILDPFRQGPEMFERMAVQSDPALDVIARTVRAFLA